MEKEKKDFGGDFDVCVGGSKFSVQKYNNFNRTRLQSAHLLLLTHYLSSFGEAQILLVCDGIS